MAQGTLTAGEVATVTLSKRVYDVVVAAAGGDIWVTSDGSTPGFGHPGAHRVVSGDSETIPVDAAADPTVIKLFSKAAAEYTITEGRAPEAAQSGASVPDYSEAGPGDVLTVYQDPAPIGAAFIVTPSALTAAGGAWTISVTPFGATGAIAWDAAAAAIQSALEAKVGPGNVIVAGNLSTSTFVISFQGGLAGAPIVAGNITVDGSALTGPDAPYTFVVTTDHPAVPGGPNAISWAPIP